MYVINGVNIDKLTELTVERTITMTVISQRYVTMTARTWFRKFCFSRQIPLRRFLHRVKVFTIKKYLNL